MKCRECQIGLETYLDAHRDIAAAKPGGELGRHLEACLECEQAYQKALIGRRLLYSLRRQAPSEPDPYFTTRLRARIAAGQARPAWYELLRPGREMLAAACLFAATLGLFAFNFHRIEAPNISEAMAMDAPHVHYHHPEIDHHPAKVDTLLSVLSQ